MGCSVSMAGREQEVILMKSTRTWIGVIAIEGVSIAIIASLLSSDLQ